MSSIERLAIQGIRSFGPDEEQTIQFRKPITLICGPNGTGKSTIIECLKYATTGILPPGCGNKSGQAFIFDTDLAGSSEVKATIKLLFRNRQRRYTLVQRHFKLMKKKTKKEFKALDGTLKMKNPVDGTEVSQSSRCSDLDELIPKLLGVSSAILDNVIFCHQEENNWPLRESRELKDKFDDIFESTRYTKALVELRKAKKDVADKAKDAQRDVQVLASHLEEANQRTKDLEDNKVLMEDATEKIENFASQINDLRSKETTLLGQLKRYEGSFEKIREMAGVIGERRRRLDIERTEFGITDDVEKMGLKELQEMHQASTEATQKFIKETQELTRDKQQFEQERGSLSVQLSHLLEEKASFSARIEEADRQRKRYDELVIGARAKYPRFASNEKLSTSMMSEAMNKLVDDKKEELAKLEASRRAKYSEETKALETVRGQVAALRHEKTTIEQDHAKHEKLLLSLDQRLSNLGGDSVDAETRLREAKERAQSQAKRVEALKSNNSAEEKKKAIEEANKEILALDLRKQKLDAGIRKLESQQEVVVRLKQKRVELGNKAYAVTNRLSTLDTSIEKLLESSESTSDMLNVMQAYKTARDNGGALKAYWLKATGGNVFETSPTKRSRLSSEASSTGSSSAVDTDPSSRLRFSKDITEKVQSVRAAVAAIVESRKKTQERLRVERNDMNERITLIQGRLQSTKGELDQLMMQKKQHEESLPKKQYLEIVAHSETREGETKEQAAIRKLEDELEQAKRELSMGSNMREMYKAFVDVVRDTNKCVTCGQGCESMRFSLDHPVRFKVNARKELSFEPREYIGSDALQLMLIAKSEAIATREKDKTSTDNVKRCEEKLMEFRKHMVTARRLEDVEQNLITKQDMCRELEQKKEELSKSAQKTGSALQSMELPLREAERIEREMNEIIRICKDAERLEDDGDSEEQQIGTAMVGGSEMEGIVSLDQARSKANQLSQTKDRLTSEILEHTKELQALQASLERERNALAEAQSAVTRLEREDQERQEVIRERKRVMGNLSDSVKRRSEVEYRIDPLEKKCDDLDEVRKRGDEESIKEVNRLRHELDACVMDQKMIDSARESLENHLKSGAEAKLEKVEADVRNHQAELEALNSKLTRIETDRSIAEQTARKYEQASRQCDRFIRYATSKSELQRMETEKAQLEKEASAGQDGAKDLKTELENVRLKLQDVSLKRQRLEGSREAYNARMNQLKMQLMESKYKDVEQRYAEQKILAVTTEMAAKDLDKYAKALDTALMRFHSEKVEEINTRIRELWQLIYRGGDIDRVELKAEQGTGNAAHTYQYRVMMRKNHTELEMRGRCSAGQKVLACLVIRLALADTFSVNCGVLALDEPSTNLDLENKKGLAEALGEIIKSRHNQDNFQLVVITHDDEFVEIIQNQIGTTGAPFYRVYREQDQAGRYVSKIKEDSGTSLT